MSRSEEWFRLAVTDRPGTFRGMEVDMPLREALALEQGELSRGRDSVVLRERLDDTSWRELEVHFARRKGLDRVVGVHFSLETEAHFPDAEAAFDRVCEHFSRLFGPPAPRPATASAGRAQTSAGKRWQVQGRALPTAVAVGLEVAVSEARVRTARLTVVMERAARG